MTARGDGAGPAVLVVGSLNVDLTVRVERFPRPGETLTGSELGTASGGKSANQAVAAALLGAVVRMVGAVGDDDQGRFLLAQVAGAGVNVSGVRRSADHATGSAMIVVDAAGENIIIVSPGANGALTEAAVGPDVAAALDGAAVVCLCLEVPLAVVLATARAARAAGAQVLVNLSPFAEVPADLLDATDVLLVNRSEAALLLGREGDLPEWSEVLEQLQARGVDRAVVTCGADGAVVLDGTTAHREDQVTVIDATRVEAVDTSGCGDAFTGATARRLAAGDTLVEAARFAAGVSALAATAEGTQTSYRTFAGHQGSGDD